PFVIIQPPPNVTGALHLGHALTATLEDAMTRRARMQRRPTLWLPGVDHASIAAQVVLDRLLADEGLTRESLGRERYLERMREFVAQTRGTIAGQQRRLGLSADWSRERFTMDEGSARAVRVSFKRLHDDGLAYRTEALINWCPTCRTSISDLEVIPTPETGTLWTVRYRLAGVDAVLEPDASIEVATTRPETILGDTAVAVHPDDERYRALVGREVIVPFVGRRVPVIADPAVQQDFGTGAVKITPAHDADDYEMGRRHGLAMIDVMNDDGTLNAAAGTYEGLDRAEARRRVVADLHARGDLAAATPHEMVIGRCQRSDDIVEPRLKVQWFVRAAPMAERAMAAVREGRTRFVPARFEKTFFHWLENIHDWNVSRQLWWGHRIPAWYCPDGHVTVSIEADGPDACEACGRRAAELRQEEDIFDTWYSSGLWPFSTLGWPDETEDLRRYYPGSVMETGYDIIFFWVARMMMLGEWLTGQTPFQIVYLHGMVRDPYGQKMSKTRGNVIDPLSVMDEIGADALRFALVHGSTPGADRRLTSSGLEGARNFANKLWNAARFVLGARPRGVPERAAATLPPRDLLGPGEHWILARCASTMAEVERAYETFSFAEAARLLHEAIWSQYCDWYLELSKARLADPDASEGEKRATWQVLVWVLDRYLRLLHPVMPFLTEHIWQRLPHAPEDPELLMVADWPSSTPAAGLAESITEHTMSQGTTEVLDLIGGIRNARAEAGIDPATWLPAVLFLPDEPARRAYEGLREPFARLARVRPVTVAEERGGLDETGTRGGLAVLAHRAEARLSRGDADLEREQERLRRSLAEAEELLGKTQARLADRAFVDRAPEAVVSAARARAAELNERIERLSAGLEST
nr:valine--tRNA ligase [Chloroflexota bacterium]